MEILRFLTAGSVDDGKSTLIGRLLYDSGNVPLDVLEAIQISSAKRSDGLLDLSLLTDGLRAEREQGITIDVAYKYFRTERRKFIIADSPGHIQYTRNMVTAASNSELVLLLVDARNGIVEQTRRHTLLCSLLGIRHYVLCVNKMDLVDYDRAVYDQICADFAALARHNNIPTGSVYTLPLVSRQGANLVNPGTDVMPWYTGPTLLQLLEQVPTGPEQNKPPRFQVQWVIRPQSEEYPDYRGYAGKILSGTYTVGMPITVLPSGMTTTLARIELGGQDLAQASAPASVILHLADDVDVSRGDSLVTTGEQPQEATGIAAHLCWMDGKPLQPGGRYLLQHGSARLQCSVRGIRYRMDIQTHTKEYDVPQLQLNDIAEVDLGLATPLYSDLYGDNPANGAFILIDPYRNDTVAAGMVTEIA